MEVKSKDLWRMYINKTITILDIIHRHVSNLGHNIRESVLCLRLQVDRSGDRDCLLAPVEQIPLNDGDTIHSPIYCVLNNSQGGELCP
jgi:hypothetical protein